MAGRIAARESEAETTAGIANNYAVCRSLDVSQRLGKGDGYI